MTLRKIFIALSVTALVLGVASCSMEKDRYTVSYDYNGHGGDNFTVKSGFKIGTQYRIEVDDPTAEGFDFGGWFDTDKECTGTVSYKKGDSYTIKGTTKFYAKWTEAETPDAE